MSDLPKTNNSIAEVVTGSPTGSGTGSQKQKVRPKSAYYESSLGNISFSIKKNSNQIYGIENGINFESTIEQIEPKSPAESVKLEVGDRIISINGKNVENFQKSEIQELLLEAETEIEIGIFRPPTIQSPARSASVDSSLHAVTLQNNSHVLNEGIRQEQ